MEVDILVDLNGYTEGARTDILCYRAAPVQVSYMGYPGTMGTDCIDYIVADEVVVPPDRQRFYHEKVLYVPGCYWVNDSTRAIGPRPSRTAMGLPEQGFVFCCFNNSWKMTAAMFDIWMRLLHAVPGSVLWLLEANPVARAHLCREAAAQEINPARLVFAEFTEPAVHLGRHGLADLFLDTLPYNAHTTACDALLTGVPVVTLMGQSFAGRVAASLLKAVGLPDLVTETAGAYEKLALNLATDPERLTAIRNKLAENRARALLFDTDRFRREIERIYETIALRPLGEVHTGPPVMTQAEQWFAQAVANHRAGNFAGAERLYLQILDAEPTHVQTRHLLGVIRAQQGRSSEALLLLESAMRDEKGDPNLPANYGNVLKGLNRSGEALENFDAALAIDPRHLVALYNKGQLLHQMRRYDEALAVYDRLLAIKPDYTEAWNNRGNVLRQLKRPALALDDYRKALAIKPRDAVALTNLGNAFADLAQFPDALSAYHKALSIKPDYHIALYNSGLALERLGRSQDALQVFDRLFEAEPAHPYALGHAANAALKACDWPNVRRMASRIKEAPGTQIIPPFVALGYGLDAPTLLERTRAYMQDRLPVRPEPLWQGARYGHERIRLGYLSTDFREHAVSFQMIDVLEHHDRAHFEVVGLSLGYDDGSAFRSRLVKSFNQFHDLTSVGDLDAARLMRGLEIDVAIDLSGLTQDARPEILAHRPAPVQVNYLGFAGTMGADFVDYVIGDAVALPLPQQPFFTEQIVHLPGCFMAGSAKKTGVMLSRREAGLPEDAFVFCCFSNSWKIAEPVFDLWMRVLADVPEACCG